MNSWRNSGIGGDNEPMQHKRLVIDANILIRAVLGQKVRGLIERYCDSVAFYVAEANAEEAGYYLAKELAAKRGLDEATWRPVFDGVLSAIQIITSEVLAEVETEAKERIGSRDLDDWPGVAAAMVLDCPIWTEDKDFLGAGVATWTTATVEIYLSRA
ncbi:MAG: PIN domain-containing protein [Proteobacteria bacterium]|nr:PIN domain-containing protein [Pseudomonadota bacterium]